MIISAIIFFLILIESIVLGVTGLIKDYISGYSFLIGAAGFIVSLIAALLFRVIRHRKPKRSLDIKKNLVYLICGILFANILMFSLNNFMNLNITKEEIKSTLIKNYVDFSIVADYLMKQPGKIECNIDNGQLISESVNYKRTPLVIEDDQVIKKLDDILRKHGCFKITKTDREVVFLMHQVMKENGYDEGIAYVDNYEEDGLINQSYSRITDNWYYFFNGYV